jgi:hypothetical protein
LGSSEGNNDDDDERWEGWKYRNRCRERDWGYRQGEDVKRK